MKIFVLYKKSTKPSGEALALALKEMPEIKNQHEIIYGTFEKFQTVKNVTHVINVGVPAHFQEVKRIRKKIIKTDVHVVIPHHISVINPPSVVGLTSNKKSCRLKFQEGGLPAPKLWTDPNSVNYFPVVGRPTHHSKGKGFYLCKNKQEVLNSTRECTHWMQFIPNTREFRVHVAATMFKQKKEEGDYCSIKLSEKLNENPSASTIIKNYDHGWRFLTTQDGNSEVVKSVRALAKKAASLVNLDFGAVDVIFDLDRGTPLLLEINSAPCLTDDTADTVAQYAKQCVRLLGLNNELTTNERKIISKLLRRKSTL